MTKDSPLRCPVEDCIFKTNSIFLLDAHLNQTHHKDEIVKPLVLSIIKKAIPIEKIDAKIKELQDRSMSITGLSSEFSIIAGTIEILEGLKK